MSSDVVSQGCLEADFCCLGLGFGFGLSALALALVLEVSDLVSVLSQDLDLGLESWCPLSRTCDRYTLLYVSSCWRIVCM